MKIEQYKKFELPGYLTIEPGISSLPFIKISNAAASAEICLLGAHLCSFIPKGQKDLLWVSKNAIFAEGEAIRGGIPICWPWFAAGPFAGAPAHGFVRTTLWKILSTKAISDSLTEIVFQVASSENDPTQWRESFLLTYTLRVGESLEIELKTENTGESAFIINQALHSYYAVANIEDILVSGFENAQYIDKTVNEESASKIQKGKINFSAETDAVFENSPGPYTIIDPNYKRKIRIESENSNSAVVWNPWIKKGKAINLAENEYKNMLCVENCNIFSDSVKIKAKESHTLKVKITLENS